PRPGRRLREAALALVLVVLAVAFALDAKRRRDERERFERHDAVLSTLAALDLVRYGPTTRAFLSREPAAESRAGLERALAEFDRATDEAGERPAWKSTRAEVQSELDVLGAFVELEAGRFDAAAAALERITPSGPRRDRLVTAMALGIARADLGR